MSKEEMQNFTNVFEENNWNKCIQWIEEYWDLDYGTISIDKTEQGRVIVELTTGGWSKNEDIIDMLVDTMFWLLWWQESKRGGYYKFIYTNKKCKERKNSNDS